MYNQFVCRYTCRHARYSFLLHDDDTTLIDGVVLCEVLTRSAVSIITTAGIKNMRNFFFRPSKSLPWLMKTDQRKLRVHFLWQM